MGFIIFSHLNYTWLNLFDTKLGDAIRYKGLWLGCMLSTFFALISYQVCSTQFCVIFQLFVESDLDRFLFFAAQKSCFFGGLQETLDYSRNLV